MIQQLLRYLLPCGVIETLDWQRRFVALGFDQRSAWQAILSSSIRDATDTSRIEYLPSSLRGRYLGLVVDVGANEGQWLSALLRFVNVARVEAFEPHPDAFAALSARFAGQSTIRLHREAAGEQAGHLTLHSMRSSVFSSFLPPTPLLRTAYEPEDVDVLFQVQVPVAPLDSALEGDMPIDLLKIDAQGFERHVLAGASQTLRRTRVLLIETNFQSHYDGEAMFGELYHQLTAVYGFTFWTFVPPLYSAYRRPLWTDTVFVRDEVQTNQRLIASSRRLWSRLHLA